MKLWKKLFGIGLLGAAVITAGVAAASLMNQDQFRKTEESVTKARDELANVPDMSMVFRRVAAAVEPSVVNINVRKKVKVSPEEMPFNDRMFRRFFRDYGDALPNLPPGLNQGEQGRTYEQIGTGSGVIMDAANGTGYILTNNHVAGGATDMDVTLADGRRIKDAKLVGADPKSDLAVVEIKADYLIPAKWGDSSQLRQGDRVMAFGSPFGYVGSMTHGIVSALHRQAGILGEYGYEDFIQVDAPINPGNSGGPLVDTHGNVVGINTAIASQSGGFQGIGFAIPSNEAKQIYNTLKAHGKIVRGWLGIQIVDVAKLPDEAASTGYKGTTGVLVKGVLHGTPATGKLQPGDVITGLNGKTVRDTQQLRDVIAMTAPGTEVKLQLVRNGKQQDVQFKVGEQPSGAEVAMAHSDHAQTLGMRLTDLTDQLTQRYSLNIKSGALVTSVEPGSAAARAGIQAGDVITRVNQQDVSNATEATNALGRASLSKGVRLLITNHEGTQLMFLQSSH